MVIDVKHRRELLGDKGLEGMSELQKVKQQILYAKLQPIFALSFVYEYLKISNVQCCSQYTNKNVRGTDCVRCESVYTVIPRNMLSTLCSAIV